MARSSGKVGPSFPLNFLKHLARALFEAGVLEDDSMQALGAELGLSIEACGT